MTTEFEEVLEQAFAALDQVARGDSSGYKALYSRRNANCGAGDVRLSP